MRNSFLAALLTGTVLALGHAAPAHSVELNLIRFFGDCANEYGNVTELDKAVGECGIIQVLTNKFNAENDLGATVNTQTVDWGTYYDQLSATYSTGSIPDIAVMHRSVLPNFTTRNLVEPLAEGFAEVGVDTKDFAPAALEAVTVGETVYGLPFDLHALLFHINMDLMEQAGLVQNGQPVLPSSPEELLQHAKQMKERTGKNYFAMESGASEFMPVRLFNTWVWQQGQDVIAADGSAANLDSDAGRAAAELLATLYSEGHINSRHDYAAAEQAFLAGDVAILINGTWVVDSYSTQAEGGEAGLKNYRVANLPNLFSQDAVWSDSHLWVMPVDQSRSDEEQKAALAFLAFLNEHNYDWARTGHLAVRTSVLESEQFNALPQRSNYAETSQIARALPAIPGQRAIQDIMVSELSSIWLAGKSVDDVLPSMQRRVEQTLRRSQR
ncbi:extracellular solute-binding protein [Chelativorans sp.]|uniref:extracellular solute-binding protein n=1 Tax=Chelativorans sp. TaxID=2203393 RepID=UPI002810AC5E|nr:extracellular solute-binding protein [Chelativorans sp.]